jgi:hypothetical protein
VSEEEKTKGNAELSGPGSSSHGRAAIVPDELDLGVSTPDVSRQLPKKRTQTR